MTQTPDPPLRDLLPGSQIEIINPAIERGKIRSVLFDFDGTLSLIREGWQDVMGPMMVEILVELDTGESEAELSAIVREFVDRLTGKQTIYQMIELADQVKKRGGTPEEPVDYKWMYLERLWERIAHRVASLKSGETDPEEMLVPGSRELLEALRARGFSLFLASGTDIQYVIDEAKALRVDGYFEGEIYGALDDYENFSKAMIIEKITSDHDLAGPALLAFGDGYVEIENTKDVGGIAVGVATDEANRAGVDQWKRTRLIGAGADVIVPEFREHDVLLDYLCPED
ncbi:MAG TPA: HAD hydrolase-like protein [Armatimonadota bacterium]|nr:HAD hydrolase-like protein [Armatimonadota bacterium]